MAESSQTLKNNALNDNTNINSNKSHNQRIKSHESGQKGIILSLLLNKVVFMFGVPPKMHDENP